MICPGTVYRADEVDATHSPVFHQLEGLVVDKGITMGDLKGALEVFAKELFGKDIKVRFRPHHFPLQNHLLKWMLHALPAEERAAVYARAKAILKFLDAVWCIRMFLKCQGLIPKFTAALLSEWVLSVLPCSATE